MCRAETFGHENTRNSFAEGPSPKESKGWGRRRGHMPAGKPKEVTRHSAKHDSCRQLSPGAFILVVSVETGRPRDGGHRTPSGIGDFERMVARQDKVDLPPVDEPCENVAGASIEVGGEESLRL
jgi:hypothetical protein